MAENRLDLEAIFFAARQKPPQDRAAFLDQLCGDDLVLRERAEQFLSAQAEIGSFLESRVPYLMATVDDPISERPGTVLGPYKLMEQIGEGGMGLVFVAEQQQPVRRKVALKVIKPGMDTRQVIARFEAERPRQAFVGGDLCRVLQQVWDDRPQSNPGLLRQAFVGGDLCRVLHQVVADVDDGNIPIVLVVEVNPHRLIEAATPLLGRIEARAH